jgi:hypothetical protein
MFIHNGELGFAIKDDEHFLTLIVKMRADTALGLKDAAVEKEQVCVQRMGVKYGHVIELSGPAVHCLGGAVLSRIRVRDTFRERLPRSEGESKQKEEGQYSHFRVM